MFLMAFENKSGMPVEPSVFQLYVPALTGLWMDSGIKEAFSRRSEYQLVSILNGVLSKEHGSAKILEFSFSLSKSSFLK